MEEIHSKTAADSGKSNTPKVHPTFERVRQHAIESLNIRVEEYRHKNTGAQHFHLASQNDENVFLVGLRTVPMDSRGVAHILEHTVLCGSERYPVRDPFFMMIRRSLNTFMNAFTSSDWTAYPFASQNRKDFFNLMDVYLDAVFFSRLHELDFAQEGHRIEFAEPDNPESDLVFKGVVFNEMKGAMSSPVSTLWQTLTEHLFPTTTYHYNSGGEPEHIPDLSYEQLKEFYRVHYHPSNAVLMTYGNIPAAEHQTRFEERALSRFERLDKEISVADEKRFKQPVVVEDRYALEGDEAKGDKTHIVMGWLLGKSIDLEESLKVQLLSGVLLDDGASPLRRALETTTLGSAPSPLCGVEDSNREMSFMCGLEGSKPENAEALESLVLEVLEDVAENGLPLERVESVLHQIELLQREISGDSYPYGLQLILEALPAAIHRGDPVAVLNLDPVLARLRQQIQDPDFIKRLVRELLLDNPHRVRLTMVPDPNLASEKKQAEANRLAQIKAGLSDSQKTEIVELSRKLQERQASEDDPDILPKVGLDDVPPELHNVTGDNVLIADTAGRYYEQGTNGLVYQQIVAELPQLDPELIDYLPLYIEVLPEVGSGDASYLEAQAWQSRVSGGIGANLSMRSEFGNPQNGRGFIVLGSRALVRNSAEFCRLLQTSFEQARFDEQGRVREIIAQLRARREQSVTGAGHQLAMTAAASGIGSVAAMQHRIRGLQGIHWLKKLDDSLSDSQALEQVCTRLAALHEQIVNAERRFVVVGEADWRTQLLGDANECWQGHESSTQAFSPLAFAPVDQPVSDMWVTSTQVNFCSRAYKTVASDHPDAPALSVLAGFLRNGFLHTTIREQGGAYGGGAGYDGDNGAFRFYSYRDPRLGETLDDFDRSLDWLQHHAHDLRQVEEAILGVIGGIDKPGSPAGEAKKNFFNELHGRTYDRRRQFRERVLSVTLADLQRVGSTYLDPAQASTAVITSAASESAAKSLKLDLRRL
jgi:Zn-dependent M16 (insulinase) family peptidase